MVTLNTKPTAPPAFLCDCCRESVHFEDLVLLQNEAPTVSELQTYHVHARCLETFLENHAGRWGRLPKSAIDHGWFYV